jgi:hypothetical protein
MQTTDLKPVYVGHRPTGCADCRLGYYDGGKGWWCCGDTKKRNSKSKFAAALLISSLCLSTSIARAEPYCFWGMDGFAYCWEP